ncbi:helicase SKI2W-like [Amphibalanus amphitrite]|uniref:helicase SKI2W-like n=1 Tax=Amphibalanus amphitrite TaxID=1232801 RepID=UPI001C916660|nr:helicase SKI2W-like [Amphibalanus amphitrite]
MPEGSGNGPLPGPSLEELLEHSLPCIFAQQPTGLGDEAQWGGAIANLEVAGRQLLYAEPAPAQTTLLVSRDDLTFRETPVERSTVAEGLVVPPAPAEFCRFDDISFPDVLGGGGDGGSGDILDPDEYLTVAPGLSGGLEDPPPPAVGPAGDAATLEDDLLTPLTSGDLSRPVDVTGADRETSPPDTDDEGMDQLLEVAEPVWPVLETDTVPPPRAELGWARRVDPNETPPDGVPDPDVRTFEFELDTFQKQAIGLIERGENVLVVAHTSAGKTAIAEYAIARALADGDRVIYTSPVKALSNQKFCELRSQFSSVGILTGDTQLNEDAPCLICTTEILRSMLYNRPWLTERLRTVVLDEVHYIDQVDRGHIWEECLILLPPTVSLLMLSATVPNAMDLAAWVGGIKSRPVFVVSCPNRPVPLEHQLYTGPAQELRDADLQPKRTFTVLDHNGIFSNDNYQLAFESTRRRRLSRSNSVAPVTAAADNRGRPRRRHSTYHGNANQRAHPRLQQQRSHGGGGGGGSGRRQRPPSPTQEDWGDLVRHMESSSLLPAIVFVSSRRRCDSTVAVLGHMDLTSDEEKQRIRARLRMLETHLDSGDRHLNSVKSMREFLLRGLGVHHAGMLPFLKETVELLFQDGLVKVLFATETLSIGINMPTRTVVFDSLIKFDGSSERYLLPSEYIQMSGRAGRRGKDQSGTVIIMAVPRCPDRAKLHTVVSTPPDPIRSQFRLTFFMLLNMLSTGRGAASVVWNSFALWGRSSPSEVQAQLERLRNEEVGARLSAIDAARLRSQCEELVALVQEERREHVKKLCEGGNPARGKVAVISSDKIERRLAIVMKSSQVDRNQLECTQHTVLTLSAPRDPPPPAEPTREPDRELARRAAAALRPSLLRPEVSAGRVAAHEEMTVGWADVEFYLAESVTAPLSVLDDVRERTMARFADRQPWPACAAAVGRLVELSEGPVAPPPESERLTELRQQLEDRYRGMEREEIVHTLEAALAADQLYTQQKELDHWNDETSAMMQVLKELGYVDSSGRVTGKGKAACGVGYRQLLVTELVCNNALDGLTSPQLAALLSAVSHVLVVVTKEPGRQEPDTARLPAALREGVVRMLKIARHIDKVQERNGLHTRTDEEMSLQFELIEAVLDWAGGMELRNVRLPRESDQGNLCRTLQRLDETLRDVRDLAVTLRLPRLQSTVRDALVAIRRGLPFNPSIYTM